MKTIEDTAKEHAEKMWGAYYSELYKECGTDITFGEVSMKDFEAGAAFVQRWIPVEEELPEISEDNYNVVLVQFERVPGEMRECTAYLTNVQRYNSPDSPYDKRWFVYPSGEHELHNVIAWRPLQYK